MLNKYSILNYTWALWGIVLCFSVSCQSAKKGKDKPSFQSVLGMQYIEVDRFFTNGLSFSPDGYELEPSWKMYLLSDDSIKVFHPQHDTYYNYPIYHDHDSVFNVARHWMRLKTLTKDSIIFQLLSVEDRTISKEFSNAYMRFYSYEYIHAHHLDVDRMRKPSALDTAFIRAKSLVANRNPDKKDSVFAGRIPVSMTSRVKEITVIKEKGELDPDDLLHKSPSDEYLYPEFTITISKVSKPFNYTFKAYVDEKGKVYLGEFVVSPEFEESRKKILNSIIHGMLEKYLFITPGSTLGIPHSSRISLNVKGIL